jgi:hypothetical protein
MTHRLSSPELLNYDAGQPGITVPVTDDISAVSFTRARSPLSGILPAGVVHPAVMPRR